MPIKTEIMRRIFKAVAIVEINKSTLDGGKGFDLLYGGTGDDTYNFGTIFDSDRIWDADGNGSLWVQGVQLTGGKKLGESSHVSQKTRGWSRSFQQARIFKIDSSKTPFHVAKEAISFSTLKIVVNYTRNRYLNRSSKLKKLNCRCALRGCSEAAI